MECFAGAPQSDIQRRGATTVPYHHELERPQVAGEDGSPWTERLNSYQSKQDKMCKPKKLKN